MNKYDIEKYLQMVGVELQKKGVTAPILLLGGAVMLIEVGNRDTTEDIDALFGSTAIYEAAAIVADREGLSHGWLNEGVAVYIHSQPPMRPWKVFSGLQVYFPPLEYLFAMKIMANRQKDDADIIALAEVLGISSQAEAIAIVTQYIPNKRITPDVRNQIKRRFKS